MRVIILGSGNGTNAKSILETQEHSMLGNAKIVGIFSNVPSSGILDVANHYSIQTEVIPCKKITGKLEEKEATLFTQKINEYSPDLIVLAGFMKILPETLLDAFPDKIINIHPSLLPSFKGLNAIERAFNFGVKISGCTVHFVDKEIDQGIIISQAPVRRMDSDTLEIFTQKIQAAEHVILPTTIANLSLASDYEC